MEKRRNNRKIIYLCHRELDKTHFAAFHNDLFMQVAPSLQGRTEYEGIQLFAM